MRDKRGFFGDDRETKRYEYWNRGQGSMMTEYGPVAVSENYWDFDDVKAKKRCRFSL